MSALVGWFENTFQSGWDTSFQNFIRDYPGAIPQVDPDGITVRWITGAASDINRTWTRFVDQPGEDFLLESIRLAGHGIRKHHQTDRV